jgi:hypothetical protein
MKWFGAILYRNLTFKLIFVCYKQTVHLYVKYFIDSAFHGMPLLCVHCTLLRSYLMYDLCFCLRALKTNMNAYTAPYCLLSIQVVSDDIKNIRKVLFRISTTLPVQGKQLADSSNRRLNYYVWKELAK